MATLEQNVKAVTACLLAIGRAGTPYGWWVARGGPGAAEGTAGARGGRGRSAGRERERHLPRGARQPGFTHDRQTHPEAIALDGGTGAWRQAYGSKMLPFGLSKTREGEAAFRPFNHGGPADQGHWASVGSNGKVIYSFACNGTAVQPGVKSEYALARSHDGGYHIYPLKARKWPNPSLVEWRPQERPAPRPESHREKAGVEPMAAGAPPPSAALRRRTALGYRAEYRRGGTEGAPRRPHARDEAGGYNHPRARRGVPKRGGPRDRAPQYRREVRRREVLSLVLGRRVVLPQPGLHHAHLDRQLQSRRECHRARPGGHPRARRRARSRGETGCAVLDGARFELLRRPGRRTGSILDINTGRPDSGNINCLPP